jgi:prepilin-type N-terminal cleavage/methylation domain-containing protein
MRQGFTLLEVLLASAIAVLLMAALYVAVDMQLRQVQASRQLLERSTMARNVLNRIARDIRGSLAPPLPAPAKASSGGTGGSGSGANTSTTSGGSSGNSGTSGSSGGSGTASGSSSATTGSGSSGSSTASSAGAVSVNNGVQGSSSLLVLSTSRLPPWAGRTSEQMSPNQTDPSTDVSTSTDLRYVIYWLASGSDSAGGLARQEISAVTASDALATMPPGIPNESSYIIAEQVKSLTFSYFDGQSWQDTWDGTTAGPDGVTPLGPPSAIAITLGLETPGGTDPTTGQANMQQFRHVVVIPSANGALLANGNATNSTSASSSTSTSGSSTTN